MKKKDVHNISYVAAGHGNVAHNAEYCGPALTNGFFLIISRTGSKQSWVQYTNREESKPARNLDKTTSGGIGTALPVVTPSTKSSRYVARFPNFARTSGRLRHSALNF